MVSKDVKAPIAAFQQSIPPGMSKIQELKKGDFTKEVFAKMYASPGCGAPGAKCTAGPNILGYFLFPSAGHWTMQKPPLLKPPFLGS